MTDMTPEKALAIMQMMEEKHLMFRFGQAARLLGMETKDFRDSLEGGELPYLEVVGYGKWKQTRIPAVPLLVAALGVHIALGGNGKNQLPHKGK